MNPIRKRLRLTEDRYYEIHLHLINALLLAEGRATMTEMEAKVLSTFMLLKGDIVNYRFSSTAKKIVMNKLDISDSGLSNYMKFLISKRFIIKDEETGKLSIWPLLIPEETEQNYIFKLEKIQSNVERTSVSTSEANSNS